MSCSSCGKGTRITQSGNKTASKTTYASRPVNNTTDGGKAKVTVRFSPRSR